MNMETSHRFFCPNCRTSFSIVCTAEDATLIKQNDSICARCMEDMEDSARAHSWVSEFFCASEIEF